MVQELWVVVLTDEARNQLRRHHQMQRQMPNQRRRRLPWRERRQLDDHFQSLTL